MPDFRLQHFDTLDSTNTYLIQQAGLGEEEGLVVVTDYQTAGRGRFEKVWVSPPGLNLLFSILLRPPMPPSKAPVLTQVICRSIARVLLNDYGLDCTLKKPNDILINGKKICGILVEASTRQKQLECVVVGVGLNVNAALKDLPPEATSIQAVQKKGLVAREALLQQILAAFREDLRPIYQQTSDQKH